MDVIFQPVCGDSPFWDVNKLVNNTWPEFTQCFQWTVLSWIPDAWLWLNLPIFIWYIYFRHPTTILRLGSNKLNLAKIFLCLLQAVLTLFQIFSAVQHDEHITPPVNALYVSCSLSAVTYVLAAVMTRIARKAGIASPCILFFFWFMKVVTHIVPLYTFVLLGIYKEEKFHFNILCVSFAFIVIQFFLQFIAEKVILGYENTSKKQSPGIFASFPSKITFHWMTSYIWQGYRRSLSPEDIWELPEYYKSETVVPEFEKAWEKDKNRANKKNRAPKGHPIQEADEGTCLLSTNREDSLPGKAKHMPSLFRVLIKTYLPELLIAHIMRLVADTIQFFLPILTK